MVGFQIFSLAMLGYGENLSPLLFAIYLNDFESYVSEHLIRSCESYVSEVLISCLSEPDLEVFLRLYVLLYADDTIAMAETPEELQKALVAVHKYCALWKLTVNTTKTEIVIFSRGSEALSRLCLWY